MNKDEVNKAMSPEIYERFKEAVATGKWPDGKSLTQEQKETCMQAVIIYEHEYLKEEERTGYVPPKDEACGSSSEQDNDKDLTTPVKWQS